MEKIEKRKIFFSVLYPLLFVLLLWVVELAEYSLQISFSTWGVYPRDFSGLKGVLFAPLIHGDWNHLYGNSMGLLVLGFGLFYFYREVAFKVTFWAYLLTGLYTWISARSNYHIGASGLVYAYFGFLLFSGFIRKHVGLIAISFLAAFLYGSLVWGILPWDEKISWESHFWGLANGIGLAVYFRKLGTQKQEHHWEEEEEEDDQSWLEWQRSVMASNNQRKVRIRYHFRPKEEEQSENKKE